MDLDCIFCVRTEEENYLPKSQHLICETLFGIVDVRNPWRRRVCLGFQSSLCLLMDCWIVSSGAHLVHQMFRVINPRVPDLQVGGWGLATWRDVRVLPRSGLSKWKKIKFRGQRWGHSLRRMVGLVIFYIFIAEYTFCVKFSKIGFDLWWVLWHKFRFCRSS